MAIHGPGAAVGVLLTPVTRINTTGPKHGEGSVSRSLISALPCAERLTDLLVAATTSEHTTLAATCVTGPVVPVLTRSSPRTSARMRPPSVRIAEPWRTTHAAPPLATPPMVTPGLEPTIGEKNTSSPANVPTANRAVSRQARTVVETVTRFIVGVPSSFQIDAKQMRASRRSAKPPQSERAVKTHAIAHSICRGRIEEHENVVVLHGLKECPT